MEELLRKAKAAESDAELREMIVPQLETFDIERLVREQNYKGPNKEEFDRLIAELDVQEDVEVLLEALKGSA